MSHTATARGVLAVIAATALIAAGAYWTAARHGQTSGQDAVARAARPGVASPTGSPILVGSNFSHVSPTDCRFDGSGVVAGYLRGERRAHATAQLRTMRAAGVGSLRVLVWHMTDASSQEWGVVSSRGGHLGDKERANLAAFLDDVRAAGFQRVTLAFGPQWTNDPVDTRYDPRTYEENWNFVRDVRAIALDHGPDSVHFDLLNEGAPSTYLPAETSQRLQRYITRLWGDYVRTFGASDATISSIAPVSANEDGGERLTTLIGILRGIGAALPTWYEVHVTGDGPAVRHGLDATDRELRAAGVDAALVVGEAPYDDVDAARAVADFRSGSHRQVGEVIEWVAAPKTQCVLPPPYKVDAYTEALRAAA